MRTLLALLLFAGPLLGQAPNGWAPIENGWAEIQSTPATGTVTTTGTLASGQVALGSGATSITGDAGLTHSGTGTGFKLGIGTDVFLGRSSAGVLRILDGSDNYAGLRVSYAGFTAAGTGNERYWIGTGGLETRMGSGWKQLWNSAADFTTGSVDLGLSRASAGTLLVEDGSGNARDVQARTVFGASTTTTLTESSATSFATLTYSASTVAGAEFLCRIRANDATDFQVLTSRVRVSTVRKATGNTVSAVNVVGTDLLAESAGGSTLTCTFTLAEGASAVTVQANCVSSLTQTTLNISFLAEAVGPVAIAQL